MAYCFFFQFSKHSKDGSVYHTYCLNYTNALSYLEKLRKNDEFCEFEKVSNKVSLFMYTLNKKVIHCYEIGVLSHV